MNVHRIVVVGGDAAGMSAAHQALRTAAQQGRVVEVVAFERTAHTSYSACGIPYWVAGDVGDGSRLVARSSEQHRRAGVDLRMEAEVVDLDLDRGRVHYRDIDGGGSVGFDALVLATGAAPIVPAWARTDGREGNGTALVPGVLPVKTLDDGAAWLDLLCREDPRPARAVVVGGGYIGVEMAEALLRRGLAVTMVTRHDVMSSLEPDMSARITAALRHGGVDVRTGTAAAGIETRPDGGVSAVVTPEAVLPADLVVLGTGVVPETGLGAAAGLPLGGHGGYLPDEQQRLAGAVWAAGDCVESIARLTSTRVYLPLGTHANKQGRVAGENAAGGSSVFGGVLGTAITRFVAGGVHCEIGRTGLSARKAADEGIDAVSLVTEGTTASGYMPEAAPIAVSVSAERSTGRMLGMEIVGGEGSAKRIDAAATALWCGMTVSDFAGADLSYAPPFATAWEIVQIAARRLAERM